MRPEPRSTMAPTTPGNSRLRWRAPEERPPARAARATFLEDDALPIRVLRYPAAPPAVEPDGRRSGGSQLLEQRLVPLGHGRRRGPALHERAPRRTHRPRPGRIVEQGGDRMGEGVG